MFHKLKKLDRVFLEGSNTSLLHFPFFVNVDENIVRTFFMTGLELVKRLFVMFVNYLILKMTKLWCSPVLDLGGNTSVTLTRFLLLDSRIGVACFTCWMGRTECKVQIYYLLLICDSLM